MKIKRVTVIINPGEQTYQVGFTCNGITIHTIENHSQEFPDGWNNLIIGFDENRETLFEIINCPTIITYETVSDRIISLDKNIQNINK